MPVPLRWAKVQRRDTGDDSEARTEEKMTVTFEDLKSLPDTPPVYVGRGAKVYTPVSHHSLLSAVHRAWDGPKPTFRTTLEADNTVMVSTVARWTRP